MNFFSTRFFTLLTIAVFLFNSCGKDINPKNEITPDDDIVIGRTLDQEILDYIDGSPAIDYLKRSTNSMPYSYIDKIIDKIDSSSNFKHLTSLPNASAAPTTVRIVNEVGNTGAFIVPGGYIYFHVDFFKKITTEAQFVAVLSHLMACSYGRYTVDKLEDRFSTSFMIDLALGGGLNASNSVSIAAIISELEDVPYSSDLTAQLDIEAENTVCELGYDVRSYAHLFGDFSSKNLKWYLQFPRPSISDYATHLFNNVGSDCSGTVTGQADYAAFTSTLP